MILKAIMDLLKAFILFLVGLLPTLPDLTSLKPAVDALFSCYENLDSFIDVRIACICILAMFVVTNAQLIWSIVMWVVKKIPGVS